MFAIYKGRLCLINQEIGRKEEGKFSTIFLIFFLVFVIERECGTDPV